MRKPRAFDPDTHAAERLAREPAARRWPQTASEPEGDHQGLRGLLARLGLVRSDPHI